MVAVDKQSDIVPDDVETVSLGEYHLPCGMSLQPWGPKTTISAYLLAQADSSETGESATNRGASCRVCGKKNNQPSFGGRHDVIGWLKRFIISVICMADKNGPLLIMRAECFGGSKRADAWLITGLLTFGPSRVGGDVTYRGNLPENTLREFRHVLTRQAPCRFPSLKLRHCHRRPGILVCMYVFGNKSKGAWSGGLHNIGNPVELYATTRCKATISSV